MKLLTCQKPNKFYFFFLAYFIAQFSYTLFINNVFQKYNTKIYMLFRIFLYTLSHIPSFIPYFIRRYLSKRKENSDSDKLVTNYIYNEIPKKYKCKYLIKPLFIISLFKFFSVAPYYLFCILTDKTYQYIYTLGIYSIINAVLIYIFSYFILKTYFYKHHYLSFSINCFAFLLSLIKDIVSLIVMMQKERNFC